MLYPQNGDRFVTNTFCDVTSPCVYIHLFTAFSALTLLVGRQEGHPACKKTEW